MKKTQAKPHDRFVKELLSHPEAAAEFLTHALPVNVCALLDFSRLYYTGTSYTNHELREWLSDMVIQVPLKASDQQTEVSILIEHKSFKDRLTPFQLLAYVAAGYQKQIKQGQKPTLIIPVVYYHGQQKWEFPALSKYFPSVPEPLKKYIPRIQTEMLSIKNIPKEHITAVSNGMLLAAFMLHKGVHERFFALEEYARVFNLLNNEKNGNFFISTILYIFETEFFKPVEFTAVASHFDADTKNKTMTLREHFIAEGRQEGMLEGIEKGIEKGIKEGSLQSRYDVARKMLKRRMPINEICELTDLTPEEVQGLKL